MKTRWSVGDNSNDRRRLVKTKDKNKAFWGNAFLIVQFTDKVAISVIKQCVVFMYAVFRKHTELYIETESTFHYTSPCL